MNNISSGSIAILLKDLSSKNSLTKETTHYKHINNFNF